MSLMKPENRERFKANERTYLDEWPMTEGQKQAVAARDYNAMIAQGGNIYFLAKIFSTDGVSFQTGRSVDDRHDCPRVRRNDARGRAFPGRSSLDQRRELADGAHYRRPHDQPRTGDWGSARQRQGR